MTKAEFLAVLSVRLQDVPVEEREEALQYYSEYLDEAGTGDLDHVIAELGGPEKVANIIRANCAGMSSIYSDPVPKKQPQAELELDETDYAQQQRKEEAAQSEPAAEPRPQQSAPGAGYAESTAYDYTQNARTENTPPRNWREVDHRFWWILGIVITAPLWGAILSALIGVFFGLFGAAVAVIGAGIAAIFGALVALVASLPLLGTATASGIVNLGISLLVCSLGLFLSGGGIWCLTKAIQLLRMAVQKGIAFLRGRGGRQA